MHAARKDVESLRAALMRCGGRLGGFGGGVAGDWMDRVSHIAEGASSFAAAESPKACGEFRCVAGEIGSFVAVSIYDLPFLKG